MRLGSFPEGFVAQFVKKFAGENADYDFESNIQGALTYDLTVEDKNAETKVWHEYNFHGVPAIGARTILTKLITDLKNMKKAVAEFYFARCKGEHNTESFLLSCYRT